MDETEHENFTSSHTLSPASDYDSASDSDAVNTTSARVYFGPLTSPEKRKTVVARRRTLHPNIRNSESPRRRSPRLSVLYTSTSPLKNHIEGNKPNEDGGENSGVENDGDDGEDENASLSRSGTPDNDNYPQDEPSSALATKIIRAHDNPSPPPDRPASTNLESLEFPLIDISESPFSTPAELNTPNGENDRDKTIFSLMPISLSFTSPSPPRRLDASMPHGLFSNKVAQEDLISFESFDASPRATVDLDIPIATSSGSILLQPTHGQPSVDELLLISPNGLPDGTLLRSQVAGKSELPDGIPSDLMVERLTGQSLSLSQMATPPYESSAMPILLETAVPPVQDQVCKPEGPGPEPQTLPERPAHNCPSLPTVSLTPLIAAVIPSSSVDDSGDQEDAQPQAAPELPQTPLRRSSRPRRSGTPHVFRFVTEPEESSPEPVPNTLIAPSSAQTKKRRKGKERAVFSEEITFDSQEGIENKSESPGRSKSLGPDAQQDVEESSKEGRKRSKSREERRGKERDARKAAALHREVGSLSPDSVNLLTQLLPLSTTAPVLPALVLQPEPIAQSHADTAIPNQQDSVFPSSIFPRPHAPSTPRPGSPVRFQTPIRLSSPVRSNATPNIKSTYSPYHPPPLFPSVLDDPTRSPARRIPIEKAIAQGQVSAQKATQLGMHGAVRAPVFTIRPTDSPARRVVATPSADTTAHIQGARLGSPVRQLSVLRERSASVEPKPKFPSIMSGKARERSNSAEDKQQNGTLSGSSLPFSSSGRVKKLPFPLVPSGVGAHPIPEEEEKEYHPSGSMAASPLKAGAASSAVRIPASSPVKSSLKQATSRIPRIGAKPYARPAPMTKVNAIEKTRTAVSEMKHPSVMRKMDLTKVVSTRDATKPQAMRMMPTPPSGGSDDTNAAPKASGSGLSSVHSRAPTMDEVVNSLNLKRKRGLPEKVSPPNGKGSPVSAMRQRPVTITPRYPLSKPVSSPVKKPQAPKRMRKVVDRNINGSQDNDKTKSGTAETSKLSEQSLDAATKDIESNDGSSQPILVETSQLPPEKSIPIPPSETLPSEDNTVEESSTAEVRRTTRLRKTAQPTPIVDVFGTAPAAPSKSRRKGIPRPLTRADEGGLSGMSAVALKALTSTNTVRNQGYATAKLEMEVIRKEGARPASPTVKVKTVLQRQQEERGKRRAERAEKRAKGKGYSSPLGQSDTDGQSEQDDSSVVDDETSPSKHRRGPGDEEDYQTPDKPLKRPKFAEGDVDNEAKEEERRVKWHRGLFTTIYLDEIHPRTRSRPMENATRKGCLTPKSKSIPLDTLGNHPHAQSPLADLVPENIVVKKFVYENEEATEKEEEEVYVVRSTRSRTKKNKS